MEGRRRGALDPVARAGARPVARPGARRTLSLTGTRPAAVDAEAPDRPRHRAAPWTDGQLRVAALVLVFATYIRLRQWLGPRSLWYDELLVADSIVGRGYLQLATEPLAHAQSAPPLWLWAEKTSVLLFGFDERALRLPALLAGVASVVLVGLVSRRLLPPVLAPVPMALVGFSPVLLRYSNEVKQYAVEVAVVLLLLLLALRVPPREPPGRPLVVLALAGAVAVWAATASVFVLAGVSVLLVLEQLRWRGLDAAVRTALVLSTWLVSLGIAYVTVLRASQESQTLQTYWASSFPGDEGLLHWAGGRVLALAAGTLSLKATLPLAYAMLGVGLVLLLLRGGRGGLAVLLSLLAGFAAAGLSLYPLGQRVALWTIPLAALVLAAVLPGRLSAPGGPTGRRWAEVLLRGVWLVVALLAMRELLVVPAASAQFLARNTYVLEELRPLLGEVQARRRPGDGVLVEQGAEVGSRLYQERTGLVRDGVVRLAPSDGPCDDAAQLSAAGFDRRPTWVVVSHISGQTASAGGVGRLLARVSTQAHEVQRIERWKGNYAVLFEPGGSAPPEEQRAGRGCFVLAGP